MIKIKKSTSITKKGYCWNSRSSCCNPFLFGTEYSGAINGLEEAQAQTGKTPNVITITGTTDGEIIRINEDNVNAEICAFEGVVVRGSGVTPLGHVSSCPGNARVVVGWDISPNPSGIDTVYKVVGNGFSIGGGGSDEIRELTDGLQKDNDVYILDANQFSMFDGPGDDVYNVVTDLSLDTGQKVIYSDAAGNDKEIFTQR
jgi:hypothetical protein